MVNIYGTTQYGSTVYGDYSGSSFSVSPFSALPVGYNTIQLSWNTPYGNWDSLRLLKSTYGYAVNENDGTVLIDEQTSANTFTDVNLLDNTWYYYSIWLLIDGVWVQSGNASGLSVGYLGMLDWILATVPEYYLKYSDIGSNSVIELTTPISTEEAEYNPHLFLFLTVMGWGLDYLKAYGETALWVNDPAVAHISNVELLAANFGISPETQVSANLVRERVANAGELAATRGTLKGLTALAEAASGWAAQLSLSTNIFLNGDQSQFEHPVYQAWSPYSYYVTSDRVVGSNGAYYQATANSFGQDPTTTSGFWESLVGQVDYTLNPKNPDGSNVINQVDTWLLTNTDGSAVSTEQMNLVMNVNGPLDGTGHHPVGNVLQVAGESASAFNGYITSNSGLAGISGIEEAIPLVTPYIWDDEFSFQDGDYAIFNGIVYVAIIPNSGKRPDIFIDSWNRIGVDDRVPLQYSFAAHAGWSGTTASASGTVASELDFYDAYGNLIQSVSDTYMTGLVNQGVYLETFGENQGSRWLAGLVDGLKNGYVLIDASNQGNWLSDVDNSGNAVAVCHGTGLAEVGFSSKVVNSGDAQCFAVTFRSGDPIHDQRLVLNYQDSNDLVYVNRSSIVSVVSGTASTTSLSAEILDGQRIVVEWFTETGVINVYVDGSLYGTKTVATLPTGYDLTAGLMVA